jgi:hypothetical protein
MASKQKKAMDGVKPSMAAIYGFAPRLATTTTNSS